MAVPAGRSHVGAGVAERRVPPGWVAFPLPSPLRIQPASPSRDPAPSFRDSPSPVGHQAAKLWGALPGGGGGMKNGNKSRYFE